MIHGLWEVFLALVGADADDDEDGDEDGASRFVPSPLDLSVRVGHGGGDDEVVRELSKVSEQARELDHRRSDE